MRPFKMFFGMAIAMILFFFVARIVVVAFVIAAVMSLFYAAFRKLKHIINYDRFGNNYMRENSQSQMHQNWGSEVEPLFNSQSSNRVQVITAI